MTDFVINRPPPGSPEWTMWSQDLATPPTLGQTLREGAMETTGAIQRFLEEAPYAPGIGGTLGRGMIAGGLAEGGAPPENVAAALQPQPDPVKRPAAEINEQAGGHVTDQPMGTHLSDLLIDAKRQEIERENIWSRWANVHAGWQNFLVGSAAILADPLNAASLFVPGIGEEAILARLGAGIVGRTIAGGVSTALGATAAQLPLTALKYGIGQQEGSDYDLRAAFSDMAASAVGGAILGGGFGALAHTLRSRGLISPELPRETLPQAPDITAEATRVLDAPAEVTHAATGVAVAEIAEGRPVDVEQFFNVGGRRVSGRENVFEVARQEELVSEIAGGLEQPFEFETAPGRFTSQELHNREVARGILMPPAEARQPAPAARISQVSGTQTVSSSDFRQMISDAGGNMGLAADQLVSRAQEALDAGRPVTYHAEGKAIPIVAIDRGMMADAKGNRWGMMLLTSAGNHLDIGTQSTISPADMVDRQRQLSRDGYAPGVSQEEMRAGNEALASYLINRPNPKAPEKVPEGWATGQAEKAEEGVPEVGRHAMPEPDPELADAEQRFARQPRVAAMLPEEQEELARTQEALGKAQSIEQALQAAAECLKDTGI